VGFGTGSLALGPGDSSATDTAGTPITVGSEPVGIAITPDGKTAYVAD
jgi:DNA-binding beta-propeller fold protein YncE